MGCFWNSWFMHERKDNWYLYISSPSTSEATSSEKLCVSDFTTDERCIPLNHGKSLQHMVTSGSLLV